MKRFALVLVGLAAVLLLSVPTTFARNPDMVSFGYKSAELSPAARTQLEQMSLDLKHLKIVLITSYVPDVGDVQENQLYANQRVEVVKNFLTSQGVSAEVISTQTMPGPASKSRMVEVSYGSATPMASSMPPAMSAQPPAFEPPPPVATPPSPPAQEPVITAKPAKTYQSGVEEVDISNQPFRGSEATPPSRWEY